MRSHRYACAILMASLAAASGAAQERPAQPAAAPRPMMQQGPVVVSPEVQSDRRIVFRLLAPQAETVLVQGGDIPGIGRGAPMTKGENGIWEVTIGPVPAGAFRYTFQVNGVAVVDPRNPEASQSNNNLWSVVVVPGSDFQDIKDVPHGAVAEANYYSTALKKNRRMHIYTPPGYEMGREKYPVFYLLHGASDSDDSWTSVGRANFILDNLIAARKAKPMIVVMPAGHTSLFRFGFAARLPAASGPPPERPRDEFLDDFVSDIMPHVEKNYRVLADRQHRAIAGLSMGGGQTMNIAFSHLDKFAYIGVYSSGILGGGRRPGVPPGAAAAPPPPPPAAAWEQQHLETLDNAGLKKGLKLIWFSTGVDDGLIANSRNTVEMLKKHGFNAVFKESAGGHTWLNWRDYLNEFAPQLF